MHSFGMNTSVYKHVRKIVQNFGYKFLISKIQKKNVAGEDPEGENRLFSCCEKRYFLSETV
jgi:hypothetical protein